MPPKALLSDTEHKPICSTLRKSSMLGGMNGPGLAGCTHCTVCASVAYRTVVLLQVRRAQNQRLL
jgi:hypothetical protein